MVVRGRHARGTGVAFAAFVALAAVALAAAVLPAPAAAGAAPTLEHLVAFKSGKVTQKQVAAPAQTVRVAGRRCAVAQGTALAALLRRGSCQRTLRLALEREPGGMVSAVVRGYDDEGRSVPVRDAAVTAGSTRVATDARGRTPPFDPDGDAVRARKRGLVPSFAERAPVR